MNPLLQIDKLTKSYGDRMLFADITFGINEGDKIGLIAKNGTGKTTMLRIIAGKESADSGTVVARNSMRIGYLEQSPSFPAGTTIVEACMAGRNNLSHTILEYERALQSGDTERINRATDAMDASQAWDFEQRLLQLLTSLGIEAPASTMVDTLSGGQVKRVALAAMLIDEPDLMILDEPTNHLDIPVIEWLEQYLTRSRTTLLMVTHDRYFLDNVCNRIIEIDRQSIFTYDGNFDYYLRRRAERIEAMTAELTKLKNTLRREQEWINRTPQARTGKAKYRIDNFQDLKARASVNLSEKDVQLRGTSSYIGSKIFEARNISKRFGNKLILHDFSYDFARYDKVGIVGNNGVGKSTFIKMLQGIIPSDSGHWDIGETVRFGYYSQQGIDFDPQMKVVDAVTKIAEDIEYAGTHLSPMQLLNQFLFSAADQQKYIHTLSGGEKARLYLATVLMRQPNFLILDEPTNDLDIVTLGILEQYLADFKGCAIIVSHDRYFLDNIVDHLFVMRGDGEIFDFPGNYTDYRNYVAENAAKESQTATRETADTKPKTVKDRSERPPKLTFAETRELEALNIDLETLNAEKQQLEVIFNSGQTIDDIAAKSARYDELKDLIDEKELRWLELTEKDEASRQWKG